MEYTQPTDADLAALVSDRISFLDRVLSVIENEIVPLTAEGVRGGSKIFGGAVLAKSDLSTVVAVTNRETANPLHHGEIATINAFYEIPQSERPAAKDTFFISTHEPCPLCLGGITWGGWDNFFYFFSYADTKDAFAIPHDIRIHEEIWSATGGAYHHKNMYWSAWHLQGLINGCDADHRAQFNERSERLRNTYADLSEVYQASKGSGAEIPLA